MNEKTVASAPAVNPDLQAMHNELVGLVGKLNASIGQAKTSAQVTAITDEIAEVTARVNAVGRQLLTQQTASIAKNAKAVEQAIPTSRRRLPTSRTSRASSAA